MLVLKVKVISWPWPKVVYIQKFKSDFLRNYFADLNKKKYESFIVQGNENLMTWCWSHGQHGRYAHIWLKHFENLLLWNRQTDFHETWHVALGTQAQRSFFQMMTLEWPWPILWQFQIWLLRLFYGKKWKQWIFRNYCSLCLTWKLVDADN